MPFTTSPLSVTVGHERIRFQGEGHRSIADRRLHMFLVGLRAVSKIQVHFGTPYIFKKLTNLVWLEHGTYQLSTMVKYTRSNPTHYSS